MPRLWNETIEAHRRDVRDAIVETAATLAAQQGTRALTMSRIAERTGIARATLYNYFADVDAILLAWHERQIAAHLDHLRALGSRAGAPGERLAAVLEAYALIQYGHRPTELEAALHRAEHVAHATRQLDDFLRDLLADAAAAGAVRDDVSPRELATYCLHAANGARNLPSKAAVGRLVRVTLAGLRPAR